MKTKAQQLNIKQFPFEIKDENGNLIYFEDITNFWVKREFDENNNQMYYENSNGLTEDNRTKLIQEYTMEELTKILGKPFKLVK